MAQRNGRVLDLRHARHPQQAERRRQVAQVQVCGTMFAKSRRVKGSSGTWVHARSGF